MLTNTFRDFQCQSMGKVEARIMMAVNYLLKLHTRTERYYFIDFFFLFSLYLQFSDVANLFCDVELFFSSHGKKNKNKIRKIESFDIVTQQQQTQIEGEKMFVATMKTFFPKKGKL